MSESAATMAVEQLNTREEHQEADSRATFGFWVYIMTDCVLFASLFAAFAVLRNNTYGGPPGGLLFSLPYILTETLALLTSSFTCGLGILAANQKKKNLTLFWFGVTFLLGAFFVGLELHEFAKLVHDGDSWRRSGFLSSYFTLVATHGLHVSMGLLWMIVMGFQVATRGLVRSTVRRLTLLSMFWHFLDIVWIFIFTIVYLLGAL
ncbi:MAG TPA: cytochrome o ubiquinol oxidase subunit III [Candidatus Saccharimonadales bacterium]|nr:cytochrome o ubiquinol oxidase subunit III [Candidatus Saccharimonadales bacterium]